MVAELWLGYAYKYAQNDLRRSILHDLPICYRSTVEKYCIYQLHIRELLLRIMSPAQFADAAYAHRSNVPVRYTSV